MGGSEAGVDLVLIQTFLPYNVNQKVEFDRPGERSPE